MLLVRCGVCGLGVRGGWPVLAGWVCRLLSRPQSAAFRLVELGALAEMRSVPDASV